MAMLLSGKEVSSAINQKSALQREKLVKQGVTPTLAVIRCGERAGDLSYERSLNREAEQCGIKVISYVLTENATREQLLETIQAVNTDSTIHGCILLRPLPGELRKYQDEICNALAPEKDMDCCTDASNAGVYMGKALGYPPCTAQACMEVLHHYALPVNGKSAVILGRSLVVGRPVAMLLQAENATVTICHSHTENMAELCQQTDILVCASGSAGLVNEDYVNQNQVVLDVSMNWDAERPNSKGGFGRFVGDAIFEEVEPIVSAITPVPGGIGLVTTAVLISHVITAAERSIGDGQ